jgi:hypothetical protein
MMGDITSTYSCNVANIVNYLYNFHCWSDIPILFQLKPGCADGAFNPGIPETWFGTLQNLDWESMSPWDSPKFPHLNYK